MHAELIKLSAPQMSAELFSMIFFTANADQVILTFPSLQSVLLSDGADSAESHQEASALLRSLNLPQNTGRPTSSVTND